AAAVEVARGAWRFPDASSITVEGGFEPGKIYELVYRSANPPLVGLGFLAVRDTAAWLRFASAAEGNPCAGVLERAYAFGVSQSGRFLRHLLYLGLTEAESGHPVFDAVIPHVAGAHSRAGASTCHSECAGKRDVEPRRATRGYLFAGTQHTPGTVPPPDADPNTGGRGREPFNVVDYAPLLRAALVSLDRWVTDGVEPPASNVPRLADGTAVAAEVTAPVFTKIPGVRFPDRIDRPVRLDFGPELARGIVTELPPKIGAPFVTFV